MRYTSCIAMVRNSSILKASPVSQKLALAGTDGILADIAKRAAIFALQSRYGIYFAMLKTLTYRLECHKHLLGRRQRRKNPFCSGA
jgi:hypothetical protein